MKVTVYCFLPGVIFKPLPKRFSVKDGVAWIGHDYEPNTGQKKQKIVGSFLSYATDAKIEDFLRRKNGSSDKEHKAEFKKIGELLNKYRGELNEVATIIEGLISVMTIKPFPAFSVENVNVRLTPENKEDKKLIAEEKVHHTFGDIGKSRETPLISVGDIDSILAYSARAEDRLSALSIYTLAARAEKRFEMEIAYSNFFRIIEGYLGDGTPKVESALKKQATYLIEILKPNDKMLKSLKAILKHLKLPSKSKSIKDKENIVSDLVLLRHKLMHYNLTHRDRHFYSSLRIDLRPLVRHMHRAAFMLIREDFKKS